MTFELCFTFKDRAIATIDLDCGYLITDGIKFICEAKYLGKANSAAVFELAENSVIDKRIKEAA